MKKHFEEYFQPTEEEFTILWDEAIIVFDANVLLNLYRYTKKTRRKIFKILTKISGRLWLPHQVGLEFHGRRLDAINNQLKVYEDVCNEIDELIKTAHRLSSKYPYHPLIEIDK